MFLMSKNPISKLSTFCSVTETGAKILACILFTLGFIAADVFGQQPELVLQRGHFEEVFAIAVSPDGKLLATGGGDKTVRLWETEGGKELRVLSGHERTVHSISFSFDGKVIVSNSNDSIKFWDVQNGKEIKNVQVDSEEFALKISPDKKIIASFGNSKNIQLWDFATKQKLHTLTGHSENVNTISFSSDGKLLASAGDDKTIKLWNVQTGQELATLKGHADSVREVVFSNNGKILASGSNDKTIRLWDINNKTLIHTLNGHLESLTALAFSPDDKSLASGSEDKNIKLWDVRNGKESANFAVHPDPVSCLAFSLDGKVIFSGSKLDIKQLNRENGQVYHTFKGHSNYIISTAISSDAKTIVSFPNDKKIKLWDTKNGKELKTFDLSSVDSIDISPSAKILATIQNEDLTRKKTDESGNPIDSFSNENTIAFWNIESRTKLKTIQLENQEIDEDFFIQSLAISPNEKLLAGWGEGSDSSGIIVFWDIEKGKELFRLNTNPTKSSWSRDEKIRGVNFSPDGKTVAITAGSGISRKVSLWNLDTKELIKTFSEEAYFIESLAFSLDGKVLLGWGAEEGIVSWDVSTGKELSVFSNELVSGGAIAFSSDNKNLAVGDTDGTIKLWDLVSKKELKKLKGHLNFISSLSFIPKTKILISGSFDNTIKIWDTMTGKELCSLIAFEENDWLVTTPDGFFDGTPNAWRQMIWRFNNNTFDYAPIETYFNDFFYPNLLQDVLAGKSPKPKAGIELEKIDRRPPKVEIKSINGQTGFQTETNQRTAKVVIKVTDNNSEKKQPNHQQTGGAQDVRLFRNGSLVKIWRGDVLKGQPDTTLETDVPIVAGENILTAYAFNSSNVKSNDDIAKIEGKLSQKEGILYVFTIGVNKYANPAYNLNFAVPDVIDIGKTLEAEQTKIQTDSNLKQYKKTEIITLTDENATKNNILLALRRFSDGDKISLPANASAQLKTELAKIKPIQPEDGLIIQFSGHGVSRDQRFYLLPHNFTDVKMLKEQGVSDIELNEVLEKVDAGRLLMIIDACQSGQALGEQNEGRAPMNSKGLAQLAYDKGMLILTAAQSQQAALEAVKIGGKIVKHGLLTYSLLEGIRNLQADQDSNQQLWQREWFDYAVEQVPRLQIEAMKQRRIDLKNGVKGRGEIIFLDGDDPKLSPEKRRVQTPRVFYRREAETKPLIMAKP